MPIRKGHLRCTVLDNPTAAPLLVKFKITLPLVLSSTGMATFYPSMVHRFAYSAPTAPTNLIHLRAYIWNFDKWGSDYCLKWHNEMSCGSSFYQGDIHSLQMGQISSLDLVSLAPISLYSSCSYTSTKQIFRIQKTILFLGSQFWDRNACSENGKLLTELGKNEALVAVLQVEIDDLDRSSFII